MKQGSTVWAAVRYVLIAIGMLMVGAGWMREDEVEPLVDNIMPIIGATVSAGAAIWGLYVTWNTRRVPITIAARPDVPTVSPVTGAIEPPTKFTPVVKR